VAWAQRAVGLDERSLSLGLWVWDRGGEWEGWECGAGLRGIEMSLSFLADNTEWGFEYCSSRCWKVRDDRHVRGNFCGVFLARVDLSLSLSLSLSDHHHRYQYSRALAFLA